MPTRIQRKRTKGWKMPEGCVVVTRPGKYGNPFTATSKQRAGSKIGGALGYIAVPTKEDAIECFRIYVANMLATDPHWLDELRGHDLACWCPPGEACHADVLLELANAANPTTITPDRE